MFKINVDGNDISIKLIQHHFIEATYEEYILFHDTSLETELYQLPDELTKVGALENLYRLARGTNQVEQIPVNPEWFTNTGQKISGSHYVTQIVVCQKREIYYDSDSFEYVPFDVQLIRSTQEQLYEKEVAYKNARTQPWLKKYGYRLKTMRSSAREMLYNFTSYLCSRFARLKELF